MGVGRVINEQVAELDDRVRHLAEALLLRFVVELRPELEGHWLYEALPHCLSATMRQGGHVCREAVVDVLAWTDDLNARLVLGVTSGAAIGRVQSSTRALDSSRVIPCESCIA